MSENQIDVKFGVKLNELFSGLSQAQSAVATQTGAMKESVATLGSAFEGLQAKLIGFSVILGGGALFKEGVSASKEMTGEAIKLSKALGITTEAGSVLNVALKSVGLSADAYAGANQRLTRMLKSNEDGLKSMGVVTRDSNGELLNGEKIMTSAVTALGAYKEGTDRNLAAQALFGRGAAEATALLKLNAEAMEKAKIKAEELGLVVGTKQADELKAYKESMEAVGLVMDGINNVIGKALIPVLTQLAEMFAESGPSRVKVMAVVMEALADIFRIVIRTALELKDVVMGAFSRIGDAISGGSGQGVTALQVLANVFAIVRIAVLALELGFVIAFEAIGAAIEVTVAHVQRFGAVAQAAMTLKWSSVTAAWEAGTKNIENIVNASAERIMKKSGEIADAMQRAAMGGNATENKEPEHKTGKKGNQSYTAPTAGSASGGKNSEPNMLAIWEKQRATAKITFELMNNLRQEDLNNDAVFWRQALAMSKANMAEDLAAKGLTEAQRTTITNKARSEQLSITEKIAQAELAVMKKRVADGKALFEEDIAEKEKVSLNGIELAKTQYDTEFALGKISAANMIEVERALEAQRLEVRRAAQQARIAMAESDPNSSPAALMKEKDKLLEIERGYALKVAQLDQKVQVEAGRFNLEMGKKLEQGLQTQLTSLLNGSAKLKDVWNSTLKGIGNTLSSTVAKMATDWIMGQLKMRVASKETALEQLNSAAMAAAGNAYNAVVGIPYVGPFLAPVAAGVAYAGVMAFASARDGYDIPAGVNPMTQLHEREMVLPKEQADVIRGMSGGGGGGGGDMNVTISGQQLAGGFFLAHQSELVAALKKARRNGQAY